MFSSALCLLPWMTLSVFFFFLNIVQKKIMIIICCVFLGIVIASIIGGTLGWTQATVALLDTQIHSRAKTHKTRTHNRAKTQQIHTFSFLFHECNLPHVTSWRTHFTGGVQGQRCCSHELLFCKRVVLQTVYLSVECCRYDVSKKWILESY